MKRRSSLKRMGKPGEPGIVGRNLKRLLDEMDIGATELARRMGKTRSTITSIMDGSTRDPQQETVAEIARALQRDVRELTEEPDPHIEKIIASFRRSAHARTLKPPFSEADASRMRGEGSLHLRGPQHLEAATLLLLVRFLRQKAGVPDQTA